MIKASVYSERSEIEVNLSDKLKEADSIVDGVVVCAKDIQKATLEMVRQFDGELTDCIPSSMSQEIKQTFVDETLHIISEKINTEGYSNYLKSKKGAGI